MRRILLVAVTFIGGSSERAIVASSTVTNDLSERDHDLFVTIFHSSDAKQLFKVILKIPAIIIGFLIGELLS